MNRRRIALVLGALALIVPSGAAYADRPDDNPKGDTGNACPPASPNPDREPPPGCGTDDDGGGGGGGNEDGGKGNACPPDSPNPDGTPPNCGNGNGGGGGGGGENECNDGINNDDDSGTDTEDPNDCQGDDITEDTPEDGGGENECNDGINNDDDSGTDTEDPNDCQGDDITEDTPEDGGGENECNDGINNDDDSGTDTEDPNDCQGDDITEDTPEDSGGEINRCTEAAGDAGLTGDTIGQQLFDGGLDLSPLTEDPEANGPISGAVIEGGDGTPLEPVTNEVACAVDLLIDESIGGDL